jgi:hypothetical protein
LTEVYRNSLAAEIRSLGYSITKTKHGFEIDGVSRELIKKFSKRSKILDTAVAAREKEIGRKLTNNEVAVVVRKTRPDKLSKLSPANVREHQLSQVTDVELGSLRKLREAAPAPHISSSVSLSETVERAKEHIFERRTVVDEHELTAEVIRAAYGENPLAEIRAAVSHGRHGLLVMDGLVSTLEAIEHERALIESINAGIGREGALGRMPVAGALSEEQLGAAQKVLENRDTVQVFRGRAGTGKTASLAHIIEGCADAGRGVACFAPSSKAVDVLQADGADQDSRGFGAAALALGESNTIQRLLLDPEMKAAVAGKVLVVDEYGLLSSRDLKRLIDLVEKQKSRLLLVGDSLQHSSVESGSAARIIEKETRVSIAEIKEIRRQSPNKGYLRAAQALAAGDLRKGLSVLDDIGAVVEIADEGKRRAAMVSEWFNAAHVKEPGSRKGIRALMIAPTWNEIDALNLVARERLRVAGMLQGDDHEFVSLWRRDWTRAQNKETRNYEPGLILVARKRTKQFEKGEELEVVRKDGDRVIARDRRGRELSVSPRQTGTAWTVCDRRSIFLAKGDQVRLRAIGRVRTKNGAVHRVSNGSTFMIAGGSIDGNVQLADGSTLLSREFVHAYATTSHGAQGLTASAVFMTDPLSREGLYVSATRGRETIKVFTSDKVSLLAAAQLRSEDRTSATEFARQSGIKAGGNLLAKRKGTLHDLKAMMAGGAELGRSFALLCLQVLNSWWARRRTETIRAELRRVDSLKPETSCQ